MELPGIIIGKPRMIDRAISVKGTNFFMVIGSAEILPVFVTLLDDDIQAVFGDPVTYYQSPLELKPEVSITPEGRLALLFTDNDFHLRLVTATVGKDFSITLTSSDEVYTFSSVYSVAYLREGVLGLGFAAGNATDVEHSIHVLCVEEEWRGENVTMRFTNTTLLTGMEEVTFLKVGAWALFDRDNAQLILAYITSDEVDGLVIRDLQYEPSLRRLRLGSRMSNKNGGITDVDTHGVHYLALLMMTDRRFLVGER